MLSNLSIVIIGSKRQSWNLDPGCSDGDSVVLNLSFNGVQVSKL